MLAHSAQNYRDAFTASARFTYVLLYTYLGSGSNSITHDEGAFALMRKALM
jgi:hypothetical protein